jgi:hypothetical protein
LNLGPCRRWRCAGDAVHLDKYGFLAISPNAIVEPIDPKAMPVILATDEERSLDASAME